MISSITKVYLKTMTGVRDLTKVKKIKIITIAMIWLQFNVIELELYTLNDWNDKFNIMGIFQHNKMMTIVIAVVENVCVLLVIHASFALSSSLQSSFLRKYWCSPPLKGLETQGPVLIADLMIFST
jgi:hypothetical protein